MKKLMIAMFLVTGTVAMTEKANAQISLSINIGSQPAWGPVGYDRADFYYIPEANCYYDIGRRQFVYQSGVNWIYGNSLPGRYHNLNLYNTYKVVVNRPTPYRNNASDRYTYAKYRGMHNQPMIRDSHDSRYYASYNHPQHQQWVRDHGNDNHGGPGNQGNHGGPGNHGGQGVPGNQGNHGGQGNNGGHGNNGGNGGHDNNGGGHGGHDGNDHGR